MYRIGKSVETGDQQLPETEETGAWEVTNVAHRYSFWRDKNIVKLDIGDGCTTL